MPGVPLNIDLPDIGVTTWANWAEQINDALDVIVNDLEPLITTAEININADLDFNGYGIVDVRTLGFRSGNIFGVPTPGIGFLNGEFTVVDEAGRSIVLTSNGALNASALGGFTLDYISAGAEARYTDSVPVYEFFAGTGYSGAYADIRAAGVIVSNGASDVSIRYAGSTDYALVLPTSVPGAVALLSMSNTGVLSTSAAIGTAVTFTNANITLTGTAEIKHPDVVETVSAASSYYAIGGTWGGVSSDGSMTSSTASAVITMAIPPSRVGSRIKSCRATVNHGTGLTPITLDLYKVPVPPTGSLPAAFATNTVLTSGATSVTATGSSTLAAGEHFVARVLMGATAVSNTVYNLQVTWDRP